MNRQKFQLTVWWTSGRVELLTFPHSTARDQARDNLKRMQTVSRVEHGDKRNNAEKMQESHE